MEEIQNNQMITNEIKIISANVFYSENKLLEIVGEAAWKWIERALRNGEPMVGMMEKLWLNIASLRDGTVSGSRDISASGNLIRKDSKTSNAEKSSAKFNKISRTQFVSGLKEVLGIQLAWCHIDTLLAKINSSSPRSGDSKNFVYCDSFMSVLYPHISKMAYEFLLNADETGMCQVDGSKLRRLLLSHPETTPRKSRSLSHPVTQDPVDVRASEIDENDL